MLEKAKQLDRFTQAHVVCEHCAEAQLAEEGQPGEPPLLIGPQLAVEQRRGAHRHEPAVGGS